MVQDEILRDAEFWKCVDFHGHVCPGVAIGFRAAQILMKRLGVGKASDEELITVLENDACGADAVQVMTGCTFGKGNLIFKDFGKHAFTLAARKRRRAVRVCLKQGVLESGPEHRSLFEKVRTDEASPGEKAEFERFRYEQTLRILEAGEESLFTIEEVPADIPPKARIRQSEPCDRCGEPTRIDLLGHAKGKRLCTPCANRRPTPERGWT